MLKKLRPHFGKLSIILVAVIVLLVASDLVTKYLEEQFLWKAEIIPGFIDIKSGVKNFFIAFGIPIPSAVVLTMTFLLLFVLIFAFVFVSDKHVVLKVAFALMIAGALGNLVDRLWLGYVRDWFGLWMFGSMAYCNLADFWIVIGAILAAIDLLFLDEWAVFPLTKSAKEAQRLKKEEEKKQAEAAISDKEETAATTDKTVSADTQENDD